MNKQELELRNLCDLAFVSQDYETAMTNAKYPLSDFKSCKAFRFAASCSEVSMFSNLAFDPLLSNKELDSMIEQSHHYYMKSNKPLLVVKNGIRTCELY